MALTQVSTGGIKDGQVHTADLADAQITAGKLHADALDHTYTLGASGTDHYTFTGEGLTGAVNDATLYLTRGKTYRFVNGNSSGAHPFRIQSVAGAGGSEYNTGVTNNAGAGGSTIIFEVPHDAPDVLYYICTSHATMNGIFYVTGALADGSVTTAKLADDAVTTAKIANDAVDTGQIATNSVTTLKLVDESVTLAKLEHGTSSNNGKFLRANNGADPTFETVSIPAGTTINNNADNRVITGSGTANTLNGESNVIIDSSGNLNIPDNGKIQLGTGNDLNILHTGSASEINNTTNTELQIKNLGNNGILLKNENAYPIVFQTSAAERMRINSSGSLLLGTTTDLGKLTVSKVQNNLSSAGGFANPHIRLDAPTTTDNTGFTGIAYSVSSLSNYGWTAGAQRVSTGGTDGAFVFRHHSNSATGNERFRIKDNGNVEIKSTAGNNLFALTPTASSSTSLIFNTWADHTNTRNFAIRNRYNDYGRLEIMRSTANDSDATTGVISFDRYGNIGAPSGTNIYNASDKRLKKNITTLDKGLESIKSLRPVSFNWIDGFCDDEKDTLYGFIAQEVKTVDSNLIETFSGGSVVIGETTIDDTLRVKEKQIIPVLVKALQEATSKIEVLETKVAALEAA